MPVIRRINEATCATGKPTIFKTLSVLKASIIILTTEYNIKYKQAILPECFDNFLNDINKIKNIIKSNMLSYKKVGWKKL